MLIAESILRDKDKRTRLIKQADDLLYRSRLQRAIAGHLMFNSKLLLMEASANMKR